MPPLPNFVRPGVLNVRNMVAGVVAMVLAVVIFFGIQMALGTAEEVPQPQPVVAEVVEPPPEPEPEPEPAPEPEPEPEPAPEPEGPIVLLAAEAISPGDRLVRNMVEWDEWDGPMEAEFVFITNETPLSVILGAIAKQPIQVGEMITWDKVIAPGAPGFLTSILSPGHRAVTIEADRATTNANIIRPGDRVDVIVTHDGDLPGLAGRGRIAQVIVENVLVLAVGSTTMASHPYFSTGLVDDIISAADATPPNSETYTLEVAVHDAERVALATRQITLSLRPFRLSELDDYHYPLVGFSEALDVVPEPEPAPPVAPPSVRVIRGAKSSESVVATPEEAGAAS